MVSTKNAQIGSLVDSIFYGCPLKWLWDCQLDNSNKKDILPARVDIGSFNLICLGDCDRLGVRKLRLKFSSSPSSTVFSSVEALKSNKYKVYIPNSQLFFGIRSTNFTKGQKISKANYTSCSHCSQHSIKWTKYLSSSALASIGQN